MISFSPINIGNLKLANRLASASMCLSKACVDGKMSDKNVDFYKKRAEGGFSLVCIEAMVVSKEAVVGSNKACLYDDSFILPLSKVIDEIHKNGAKALVQLNHRGGTLIQNAFSASSIKCCDNDTLPKSMTKSEIAKIIDDFYNAALRAKKANADIVELHLAHGYLLHSFLSPYFNKRMDKFSFSQNFGLNIVKMIIDKIKENFDIKISCRINACDDLENGIDINTSINQAKLLQNYGVDVLSISRGTRLFDKFMYANKDYDYTLNHNLTKAIKTSVNLPIITVGRYISIDEAEKTLEQNIADIIAFGRQSLVDPYLVNRYKKDRFFSEKQEFKYCIACNKKCVDNMFLGLETSCIYEKE